MRYFLKHVSPEYALQWLMEQDPEPRAVPVFPEESDTALVVTHLLGGTVFAEVATSPRHLAEICGRGFPLGRLYFQISRSALYSVCPELTPEAF
jgi:hypothetical protein